MTALERMFVMNKADLIKTTNSLLHSLMTQVVAKLKIKDAKVTGYTPEYGTYFNLLIIILILNHPYRV